MRVVVAEDAVLLREGIGRLLAMRGSTLSDGWRCSQPARCRSARAAGRGNRGHPDAPGVLRRGPGGRRVILTSDPPTRVLVLSQAVEAATPFGSSATPGWGVGYLLKDRVANVEQFADAVRQVADGGTVIDPEVVAVLVGPARRAIG